MPTAFELSHQLVDDMVALDPLFGTSLGITDAAGTWGDVGLDGYAARYELARRYRDAFAAANDDPDPKQRMAATVLGAAMEERIAEFDHGDHLSDLAHMASSFQFWARVFDVMPKDTVGDWQQIASRLETMHDAYAGLRERLEAGCGAGRVAARRQVASVIDQVRHLAGPASSLDALPPGAPEELQARLVDAVRQAKAAAADFAVYLSSVYAPEASPHDGSGEEEYRRRAARLVGVEVDPHEAYAWGWDEFHRLLDQMVAVAGEIQPGSTFFEVKQLLETDPSRAAPDREAFREFIAERQNRALRQLDGSHFDVAEPLRTITVNFAPEGTPLGAFYLRPSEDFTRPGGIWYSIGSQEIFPLYHHVSTAYHEGFPGHHLQSGTAMVNAERISRAHRTMIWYPGYGEGWALYAERLMHELGYYEIPDYHFGMLAKHLYRATRVVVDIGLHVGLAVPHHAPVGAGEQWTFDLATEYLRHYGFRTADQAVGEVLRYLGWPGQAISYKLGEREILAIRAAAQERSGSSFDLKEFHDRLIGYGPMRFELLRTVVLDGAGY